MKRATHVLGRVVDLERVRSSRNGNPRFRVTLRGYVLRPDGKRESNRKHTFVALTMVDHMIAYSIQNPEYRAADRHWRVGAFYGRQHVELAPAPTDGR